MSAHNSRKCSEASRAIPINTININIEIHEIIFFQESGNDNLSGTFSVKYLQESNLKRSKDLPIFATVR